MTRNQALAMLIAPSLIGGATVLAIALFTAIPHQTACNELYWTPGIGFTRGAVAALKE